ncbi:MAG: hypothetical protein ACXVY8_08825 [Gaiellaceae bacterium]
MRRSLGLLAVTLAFLAAGAAPAGATSECNGLPACVRVVGPWVVAPGATAAGPRERVAYQLLCPKRFIVGGLDAELSSRQIDIAFLGKLGGPVNPGITTTISAVFLATTTGAASAPASFRPHIGCMPARQGAGVPPTAFTPVRWLAAASPRFAVAVPPGQPTVRRVRGFRLRAGRTQSLSLACRRGERLLAGSRAVGFYTKRPPPPALMAGVSTTLTLTGNRLTVVARAGASIAHVRSVVQLQAVCAGAP